MTKQGKLKNDPGVAEDFPGQASDSSDEEKKRSPRGKRSRLNSLKTEKFKEKIPLNGSEIQRLEVEVTHILNGTGLTHKASSPRGNPGSPHREFHFQKQPSLKFRSSRFRLSIRNSDLVNPLKPTNLW